MHSFVGKLPMRAFGKQKEGVTIMPRISRVFCLFLLLTATAAARPTRDESPRSRLWWCQTNQGSRERSNNKAASWNKRLRSEITPNLSLIMLTLRASLLQEDRGFEEHLNLACGDVLYTR